MNAALLSAQRQMGGKAPPHLAERTQRPERATYLWNYFCEVSRRRSHDGMSGLPNPLAYSEIEAWARLKRIRLETFEVDILTGIDDRFVAEQRAQRAKDDEPKTPTKRGK